MHISKFKKTAAGAIRHLIWETDPSILYQLGALLLGYHPESKVHVLEVCGCLLSLTSHRDLLHEKTVADSFDLLVSLCFRWFRRAHVCAH